MIGEEAPSLQARLEAPLLPEPVGRDNGGPSIADPVARFRFLETSRRFHRDTGMGRVFHPGRVSFRENRATDSLHVVIHGNHLSAHVDAVSPRAVRGRSQQAPRYSLHRTAVHNLVGMAQDLLRLARGRQGDHRSGLDCEWLWDRSQAVPQPADLLNREATAWSVQIEAQVSGSLDESRLRQALAAVLGRWPLEHDPLSVVDCADQAAVDSARSQLQHRPAGMTEWPPVRARLARSPGGDILMLTVNHAAADGFDALRLLDGIASAYATDTGPEPPPDFPAVHKLPVRPTSAPVSPLRAAFLSTVECLRDLLARPSRLAPDSPGQAGRDPSFGFHLVSLTAGQTKRVVEEDRPGTSRNILLAALHLAIGEWNLAHGSPGRRVGVLAPVNLRPQEWPDELLGNFSVTARVSTSRRHRAGPVTALSAVTAQTTRNKRARTGIALLAGLERSGLLPLWSKQSLVVLQPLTRNRHLDPALLANLGRLDRTPSFGDEAGDTVHVWFSLPARAPLTLCVGAVTVSGRLHLVLRYPCALFDADAAQRFADCFLAQIAGVADRRP